MIKSAYKKYFQKSRTFLFPFLGYKKSEHPFVQTFVCLDGMYSEKDYKLICKFYDVDYQSFAEFEEKRIYEHPFLERIISNNEENLYVFDCSSIQEDWDLFLQGKYSKFSEELKYSIIFYYGVDTPEYPYISSFLYPERYHRIYSELLDVDLDVLKDVHELCDKYDKYREKYVLSTNKFGIVDLHR